MNLQCLRKLYSGTVYSGKQRNIYEHIYKFIPPFTVNPPYIEHTVAEGKLSGMKIEESSGPETFSKKGKHIYKDIYQRSYLKL